MTHWSLLLGCLLLFQSSSAWQFQQSTHLKFPVKSLAHFDTGTSSTSSVKSTARRSIILGSPLLTLTIATTKSNAATSSSVPDLKFSTTPSGLQYADVKLGSTSTPSPTAGQVVSIDYVMSTTGARYGTKIYSTQDAGAPYRWKLGDGSTIPGLEEAVMSMNPGGIRRLIIPANLAYQASGKQPQQIVEECQEGKGLGPVPPISEALGEFQRFKNIYCNPDRVYQPDLVMDVKLYGKRN